jgi:vacuolar-type H+-ATPase subunit B/Vma2
VHAAQASGSGQPANPLGRVTASPSFQFTVDAIDTVPALVRGIDFDNRGHQFLILDRT